jgi:hypothetical protein
MSNKSIEELLELASRKIPLAKDIPDSHTDVQKFIILNQLKSAELNLVPTYFIYEKYYNWCFSNNVTARINTDFFKQLNLFFEKVKKNGMICYKLTGHGMDVMAHTVSERQLMLKTYSKRNLNHGRKKEK